jgi:hypothetical protein
MPARMACRCGSAVQEHSASRDPLDRSICADRKSGESFQDFVKRIGKVEIKTLLEDLTQLPADGADRSFFSDWGDPARVQPGRHGRG